MVLALAACSTSGGEGPGRPSTALSTADATPTPEFCGALARILGGGSDGFSTLRASAQAFDQWQGLVVPPGFATCSIVGTRREASQYICIGPSIAGRRDLDRLDGSFRATAAKIDRCLGPQAGGQARLAAGQTLRFAGGERLALWRDRLGEGPGLSLRVEEEVGTGAYTLSLTALTLR